MPEIVISEFMDEAAIREAFAGRDVLYDPQLVDDAARLQVAHDVLDVLHRYGVDAGEGLIEQDERGIAR